MSADKDNEYFSDGLTENILDKLARNPALRVMARTSSFSYKGKSVPISQIARELNVGTIIEGSVQRAGQRLRITAQLINAVDGTHVWSETFDRQLDDIFAVQDEIALKIAGRLQPGMNPAPAVAKDYPTKNLAAYDLYLRGRAEQEKGGDLRFMEQAAKFFREATALDAGFALAWAQLALANTRATVAGRILEAVNIAEARAAAATAARLAPDLPETLHASASVKRLLDYDLEGAGRDLVRADKLRPNDARTTFFRAVLAFYQGDWAQTIAFDRKSIELNPRDGDALGQAAGRAYYHGLYAESRELSERLIAIYPENLQGYSTRSAIEWLATGDAGAALAQLERAPAATRGLAFARRHADLRIAQRDFRRASDDLGQHRDRARQEVVNYTSRYNQVMVLRMLGEVAEWSGDRPAATKAWADALPLALALTKDYPVSVQPSMELARIQAGGGDRSVALATCDQMLALAERTRNGCILRDAGDAAVAIWARLGATDKAIGMLRKQYERGFFYCYGLREPQYDPLRDDPRFKQLQAEEEAKADANWRGFRSAKTQ